MFARRTPLSWSLPRPTYRSLSLSLSLSLSVSCCLHTLTCRSPCLPASPSLAVPYTHTHLPPLPLSLARSLSLTQTPNNKPQTLSGVCRDLYSHTETYVTSSYTYVTSSCTYIHLYSRTETLTQNPNPRISFLIQHPPQPPFPLLGLQGLLPAHICRSDFVRKINEDKAYNFLPNILFYPRIYAAQTLSAR